MHITSWKWAYCLLLPFTVALAFGALAAGEPAQVFHCQLKVLDTHGQPLRGVVVESYRGPDWRRLGTSVRLESRTTTDAQGTVALTTTNQGLLLLVARKPGLSLGWNGWYPGLLGPEDASLEITLTAPTALSGTVQDEAGKPVAEAAVWVSHGFQPSSRSSNRGAWAALPSQLGRQLLAARTGADGKFRIEGLPADATVDLSAAKAGLAAEAMNSLYFASSTLTFQAGQTDAVVVLKPAGSLEGKVVREDTGAPLPGARVHWGDQDWYGETEPAVADAQGHFRLPDLLPGDYKLRGVIGTNDFAEWVCESVSATVEAGVTNRNVTITANRGAVLKTTLRDQSTGKPLQHASVWLSRENANPQGTFSDQGMVRLRVTPGDYHLSVGCEGYNRQESQVTLERGQTNEVSVELEPAPRLTGTVLDPQGKPAAKARVLTFPSSLPGGEKLTDAQGRFMLYSEAHPNQFGGMNSFPRVLIVRDPAHNLATAADVEPDATNATVKLEPALTLVGRVLDPAGKPLTNAEVQVMFKTEHMSTTFDQPTRVDGTGQFEVKGLPPARPYNLIVNARGFGQEQREVEAPEPARQRVELEPFHLPAANQRVAGMVVDAEEKPVPGAWVNGNGDNQGYLHSRTDTKGRFVFPHVCAGQIQLSASLPRGGSMGSVTAEAGDTNVVIHLGVSANLRQGGKLARLAGVVVNPVGKPAPKVSLLLFSRNTSQQTDAEGRFKLTYDADSSGSQQPLSLIARDPAHNLAAVFDLDPEITNITVKLEPGLALTGRVTDTKDQPLTNATVRLTFWVGNTGFSFGQPTRTDTQGRFELQGLPAGRRYDVEVLAKGFGRESRTVQATETETRRLELDPFRLVIADHIIAGVVQDADEKPVAHAWVNFYGDKQNGQGGRSDAKGRFHFEHLTTGEVHLSANDSHGNSGNITAEAGDTNVVIQFGVSQSPGGARNFARVSGTVSNPDGKPAPHVTIHLFPFHNTEKRTDAQGHFKLTFNPAEWGSSPDFPHVLMAQDPEHNLAPPWSWKPALPMPTSSLNPASR